MDQDNTMLRPAWKLPVATQAAIVSLLALSSDTKIAQMRAGVEDLASVYLRQRKQDRATPPLAVQRKFLADIARAAKRLDSCLAQLDGSAEAEFSLFSQYAVSGPAKGGQNADNGMRDDFLAVRRLGELAREALTHFPIKSGRADNRSLYILVCSLCLLYEQLTGTLPTHSPYRRTEYTGEPQSQAGQFVILVTRAIDNKVTPQELNTAMQYAVQPSRTRRLQSSRP